MSMRDQKRINHKGHEGTRRVATSITMCSSRSLRFRILYFMQKAFNRKVRKGIAKFAKSLMRYSEGGTAARLVNSFAVHRWPRRTPRSAAQLWRRERESCCSDLSSASCLRRHHAQQSCVSCNESAEQFWISGVALQFSRLRA